MGISAGIAIGLFFGESVAPIGVVGRAFILLLQMTVLPYVITSLIKGLGRLTLREATTLTRTAGGFLLLLWVISMGAVLLMPLAFPDWPAASFFSTTLVEAQPPFDFLHLFIPANRFESLAQNVVPAVVLFSLLVGIALITIEGKEPLIGPSRPGPTRFVDFQIEPARKGLGLWRSEEAQGGVAVQSGCNLSTLGRVVWISLQGFRGTSDRRDSSLGETYGHNPGHR